MARRETKAGAASGSAEDRAYARAERVLAANYRGLLRRKGVSHVDVNYRTRDGRQTPEIVIRVHVEKKLPPEALRSNQLLTEIDGVPVDVVESRNTYEPQTGAVQGGCRIAPQHNLAAAGTLGILCFTQGTRQPRFLTNAHVVYGDRTKSSLPRRIAMLSAPLGEASAPLGDALRNDSFRDSRVDAALIEPVAGSSFLAGVMGILSAASGIEQLTREHVRNRVLVRKLGANSGATDGIVDSITLTFSAMGISFLKQIGIRSTDGRPFSIPGDSGAVVLLGTALVGLLHGATDDGRLAVACHMPRVASILGIEL